jgi:proton-dependent oligopeptide transporter, POT family
MVPGASGLSPVLLLSATELWERLSYFGLRALLVLYLVAPVSEGGFNLSDADATAIYGLFTASVYFLAVPGGWIVDRYLGPPRALLLGGLCIFTGNLLLAATRSLTAAGSGMTAIAVGSGLLKPSITTLVGHAARQESRALDGAYTVFYTGINIGALSGPLLSALLAVRFGWHAGFAASAVGMIIGLSVFAHTRRRLTGLSVPQRRIPFAAGGAIVVGVAALIVPILEWVQPVRLVRVVCALVVVTAAGGFFALWKTSTQAQERRNVARLFGLFVGATVFWAAEEQAGGSLTLFAQRFVDRTFLGYIFPAAWYQSISPLYIVVLAPLFVSLWQRLAARATELGPTPKFGAGLIFAAAGLTVCAVAAHSPASGGVAPAWLVTTYFLLAIGELLIGPIGFSAASRLAPSGRVAFANGLWLLSLSLGGLLAGLTGSTFDLSSSVGLAATFAATATALAVAGALFAIVACRRVFVSPGVGAARTTSD